VGLATELREALAGIDNLLGVDLAPGDPTASGNGPELRLVISLPGGLDESAVKALLTEVHQRAGSSEMLAHAADSVEIQLLARK
jgi:hypothetical protein